LGWGTPPTSAQVQGEKDKDGERKNTKKRCTSNERGGKNKVSITRGYDRRGGKRGKDLSVEEKQKKRVGGEHRGDSQKQTDIGDGKAHGDKKSPKKLKKIKGWRRRRGGNIRKLNR